MNQYTPTGKFALRPLPMRITQMQFERLQALREYDGLAVQEHVRRALDQYLPYAERKAAREDGRPEIETPPLAPKQSMPPPKRPPAPRVRTR